MSDDLQAMLNTIGEKFDLSFDQPEGSHQYEDIQHHHHTSINPENVLVSRGSTQAPQQDHQKQKDKEQISYKANSQFFVSPQKRQQEEVIQTSFLSLLQKEEKQGQHQEIQNNKPMLMQGETAGQLQSQQEEMEYYRSLSQKFQTALEHAKSRKSLSELQGQFIERQQHYKKKKQGSLSMLLMEKQRREKGQIRAKPLINSYSTQILNQYTPIDKRYPAVLSDRKKKVEMWQSDQRRKEEQAREEEERQMEKWAELAKQRVGSIRSNQQYYSDMRQWMQRREKNVQQHQQKKQEGIKADLSFQPKINPKSDKMMRKKPDRIPVYQKQPQVKRPPVDQHCTFKPNLSKVMRRKD